MSRSKDSIRISLEYIGHELKRLGTACQDSEGAYIERKMDPAIQAAVNYIENAVENVGLAIGELRPPAEAQQRGFLPEKDGRLLYTSEDARRENKEAEVP